MIARPFEMWSSVVASLAVEPRIAERVGTDQQPQPDPGRRLRPRREGHPTLEYRLLRLSKNRVKVVPGPEMFVAKVVDHLGCALELRPCRALRPEQNSQLEVIHGEKPNAG